VRLLLVNWQDRANPHAGGAELHLHEIFGRLAARGVEVTLLASGWAGAPQRERIDGIDVHRVGTRYSFGAVVRGYYRRVLERERFDVVVEALNKVPVFAPRWTGRPTVLLVHHLFGTTAFQEASLPVASATWLLERPLARVYRGVPVEAISASTKADLIARGLAPEQITVIHPGIEPAYFAPDPELPRFAEPTFVYIGRLKRYKGVDLAIRALARLRERGVPARLIIAGRGDDEPRLRRLAERLGVAPFVEFAGFVSEDEKRDLFRRAWANVFTSPKEGWGITNLEAAGCGTPTVASDSPGLRDSVVDGRTGVLVPHGDVEALAAALASLAADREQVERLGRGARDFAVAHSWDHAADETEAHLRAVAGLVPAAR
jgi:glycosyltransferase involved in cell wall biosynthesis